MDSFSNYPPERPFDPFSVMLFKALQVVTFLFFIALLVMNPDVLLFDEPTAALDPRTQYWLVELIEQLGAAGKTIVHATHDLDLLHRIADRAVVFGEDHRIAGAGTPDEVLADHELLVGVNLIHPDALAVSPP